MRKIFLFLFCLIFLSLLSFYLWWSIATRPVSSEKTKRRFVITRGLNTTQIAKKLKNEGIIRSDLAFKFYVQLRGFSKKIKAGEYSLYLSENVFQVVERLVQGPEGVWITLPEGLRMEEVGAKLAKELGVENPQAFFSEFLRAANGKEGYLFPDTYLLPREISPSNVVSVLTNNFRTKVAELESDLSKSQLSLPEVIVLASIVERETKTDEERPMVAGILLKRLKAGWPLQTDATIQYVVGTSNCQKDPFDCKWWPVLSKTDLNVESRFNTYKYKGLPPSPIANPGLSSIKAVIYPQNSDYWFYLHGKDGNVYYASTLEEHQKNIGLYLK